MGFWDFFKPKPKPLECLVYCVPQSIACAWSWQAKYRTPTRMAVQHIRDGVDHVQAQALIDDQWTPLIMAWTDQGPVVRPGKPHFDILPYRYVELEDWVNDQIQYVRLEKI